MKIAFVGAGNMATALIGGLINRGVAQADILAIDPVEAARARCAAQFGVQTASAMDETLVDYDAIVLAVKPQVLKQTCESLASMLRAQLVISIAAGIRVGDLSRWLGGYTRIVRSMPNTPALIGMGATGMFAPHEINDAEKSLASTVFDAVGVTLWVDDEAGIDAVTAISGSGPAYVFYFIEAMQKAAVEFGLSEEQGRTLAITTFTGAARLAAQSDERVSTLRERVTSKGGTTAAALSSFEASGIEAAIVRGALAAKIRAAELSDELGAA